MTDTTELRVFLRHCVGPDRRYCVPGMRLFAKRHGLSLSKFAREGLPASTLAATCDAMALRAIENARKEAGVA